LKDLEKRLTAACDVPAASLNKLNDFLVSLNKK